MGLRRAVDVWCASNMSGTPAHEESLDLLQSKMKRERHMQFSLTNKPRDLHKHPMIRFFDTERQDKREQIRKSSYE